MTANTIQIKQENSYLNLLRFLFSLWICLYHWGGAFSGGYLAVCFFFTLSGFLVLHHLDMSNNSTVSNDVYSNCLHFLKRKISKLYPHFLFSFIILFILKVVILDKVSLSDALTTSFWELTFLQNIGLTSSGVLINTVTWYLSAQIIAGYFVYYLLLRCYKLYLYIIAPLSIIFAFCYFHQRFGHLGTASQLTLITTTGMILGFACMSLGCIAYKLYVYLNTLLNKSNLFLRILQTIFELIIIGIAGILCYKAGRSDKDFVLVMLIAILYISVFFNSSYVSTVLNKKHIRTVSNQLGRLSYAIFLNHFAVIYFLKYCWSPLHTESYWKNAGVFLGITFVYSLATQFFVAWITPYIKRGLKLILK